MARCLLIIPPLPQRMGAPYLGTQYVAASLLADGHDVRCVDLAAVNPTFDDDAVLDLADSWRPHMIVMTLFTYNALAGYRLAAKLRGMGALLVAGGPHPTVMAAEALEHGFDLAVVGEGEQAAVRIARALDAGEPPRLGAGIVTVQGGERAPFVSDLGDLAWPHTAAMAWDPAAYNGSVWLTPGGTVTSRGCPARCTFCANYVTGRSFRWRPVHDVLGELRDLRKRHDLRHFAFWDDAFTAHRPRLRELCDGLLADAELRGSTWSCITPANMVNPDTLQRMADAGCVAINFGIESGDPAVLRSIAKGQRPEQVMTAVKAARDLGMSTVVNFMFGFPGEDEAALDVTLRTMESLAPHTDFFNNRGVLVPFPGTPVYADHHERYGFTSWWLDDRFLAPEANLHVLQPRAAQEHLEHDPTLDLDYFAYTPAVRAKIAACVRFKAQHNRQRLVTLGADFDGPLTDERDALLAVG